MADGTAIEWTDATWNIVTGCSVVSPGCTNCYAMRQAHRQSGPGGAGRLLDGRTHDAYPAANHAPVAQWTEHRVPDPEVAGSTPAGRAST